ncbi:hypothetical protein KRX51_01720 [Corynebacterium sp. TAE3-ERU12]|uniref:hypothetical protein n=1 Tax=Corynebacterium sp. TAE3-ERU12 TaxID=2849491 RepID=UPI001C48363F|nr:hypothetical protein [Corynebacterium sp. TAE3-ERU12]MBV7294635.1 hypothetical protein [Corynebacterium sp. TAE3-ERU12]
MSYLDTELQRTDKLLDDEYQRDRFYRSQYLAFYVSYWASLLFGVVLAWTLPGDYVFLSFLAFIPVLVGQTVGVLWMRKYAPRPRTFNLFTRVPYLVAGILIVIAWASGIITSDSEMYSSGSGSIGVFIGAFAGFIGAALFIGPINRLQRKRDAQRLDDELGED